MFDFKDLKTLAIYFGCYVLVWAIESSFSIALAYIHTKELKCQGADLWAWKAAEIAVMQAEKDLEGQTGEAKQQYALELLQKEGYEFEASELDTVWANLVPALDKIKAKAEAAVEVGAGKAELAPQDKVKVGVN